LKDQATQIVDAAAQRLRTLVEEMLRTAFEDFQQRLDAALSAAEARLAVHTDESNAQVESTLKKFREELDLQTEQTVASTEQVLRAQIPSIVASIFKPGAQLPSTLNVDLNNKQ
jgi:F0F1-type ATP synthase membrane subunit b/b'